MMVRSCGNRVLLVHCYYGGAAPSGEDVTVIKEIDFFKELVGANNFKHLYTNFRKNENYILSIPNFIRLVFWSNIRLLHAVICFRPDTLIIHNTFPFFSLCLINLIAVRVNTYVYMHNHRLYCANALLLRNNKYCELCLEKRYFFNGIWKRCKGNSLLKSAIYSLYGYSLRTIGLRNIRKFVVFSGKHKELILRSKLAQTDQILVLPHFVKFDDLSHSQSSSSLSDGKIKKSRLIWISLSAKLF